MDRSPKNIVEGLSVFGEKIRVQFGSVRIRKFQPRDIQNEISSRIFLARSLSSSVRENEEIITLCERRWRANFRLLLVAVSRKIIYFSKLHQKGGRT